jgi:DDE superfamily endonuclease
MDLFLFSPDGKIRACYINAPGTMHDSTMAKWGRIYNKIDELYVSRVMKIVVDSAFALDRHDLVYKSYQNNFDQKRNVRQNAEIQRQATAVRQMSEWAV